MTIKIGILYTTLKIPMSSLTPRRQQTAFVNIQDNYGNTEPPPAFALFEFAFRPFFVFASLFAIIHLLFWVLVWLGSVSPTLTLGKNSLSPMLWHAHEMVFGYGYGVIVGFLLTAVTNWTGQKTLIRRPLMLMVLTWGMARIGFFFGGYGFIFAAVGDLLLSIWFAIEFTRPVIISQNQRQWGFVGKLILFIIANSLFYADLFGLLKNGSHYGVYLGFYLVLAVVMVMGRRVIPFFTQRALALSQPINNPRWLDTSSLILFTLFTLWETFFTYQYSQIMAWLCLILFILYTIRLFNWYQPGLFRHALIWVLWLSNAILYSGFLLKALSIWIPINPYLAIHAFALGGIGLMTVGMMARVSLGHTGRSVFQPPRWLSVLFILMTLAAVIRVLFPIFMPQLYRVWIMSSATLWVLTAVLFLLIYLPILLGPRADGKKG